MWDWKGLEGPQEEDEHGWREDSGTGRYSSEIARQPGRTTYSVFGMEKSQVLAQSILEIRQQIGRKHLSEMLDVISYWNANSDEDLGSEDINLEKLSQNIRDTPLLHLLLFKEKHTF